jgi:hypothetical protein
MQLRPKFIIPLVLVLLCLSCLNLGSEKPDSGAICMTAEVLDRQLTDAYASGYAKAKAEAPVPADVELQLWESPTQITAFLKEDPSDRCVSSVPGEDASVSCLDRAQCLTKAIRDKGYDAYGVILSFQNDGSHAIVAFPMKDGTLQFVEPWFDKIVPTPEVGKPYQSDAVYVDPAIFKKTGSLLIIEKIGVLY